MIWYDVCSDYSLDECVSTPLEDTLSTLYCVCDIHGGVIYFDDNHEAVLYWGKDGLNGIYLDLSNLYEG